MHFVQFIQIYDDYKYLQEEIEISLESLISPQHLD